MTGNNDETSPGASVIRSSAWHRAATLVERVQKSRARGKVGSAFAITRDAERGMQRLAEWRSQVPFSSDALFQDRLAQAGLTEAELLELLSETADCNAGESVGVHTLGSSDPEPPPAWVVEIEQAYADPSGLDLPPFPEGLHGTPTGGILEVIRPLLERAVARLRRGVSALASSSPAPPFDPATVEEMLFAPLPPRLFDMLLRTLVLELHVARLRARLQGQTPEERFGSFIDRLRRPETALELFNEYPVLARQVVICLDNWLAASLEFLERWCSDWPAIRAAFWPGDDPGQLVGIVADAGDSHRGGRAVLIARCRSGLMLVYKPKSLAVDQHFQDLLGWLNERGLSPPFRQMKVLDRGSYGWEEFVAPAGCSSRDEVERFYRRQGGYSALLYALAAVDFHYENLIAAGEHPVLIDLEALFHPHLFQSENEVADILAGFSAFGESVLGSMLLPLRIWPDSQSASIDLSGIGAEAGLEFPWRYPGWTGQGTDEMRFARHTDKIGSSDHRPNLNGMAVNPLHYVTAIESGFCQAYELLQKHRGELLVAGSPLDRFNSDEVRVLFRATNRYRQFLDEGCHPDVLRDALDRDRLFDRLWEEVQETPRHARLIPAEVADLWRNDIPLFTTQPGARDVWASDGRRIPDEFSHSAMDEVRRRLELFGEKDLARQLWFLRASFATLLSETDASVRSGYLLVENGAAADRVRLLAASRSVAERLAEQAVRGSAGDVSWIGLTLVRDEHYSLLPLGTDLYDGVPGLTLFLAYLGAITGEDRYTSLARGAMKTMRRRLEPHKRLKTVNGIGGFSGWGGILYTLAHVGVLWNEPEILAEAQEFVNILPDLIAQDKYFEIGLGAAGCIAGLLCLHQCAPTHQALAMAVECGDHLISRARSMPRGLGWDWPFPSRGPLTGYSHGAAGIACALLELAAQTGEERFRSAALGGIEYERSLFSAEAGNWPDLRIFGTPPEQAVEAPHRYTTTWCYGAPGIGLARLRCQNYLNDPMLRTEIDTALRTTRATGFGLSHILCHGDLGNLELLLEAAQASPDSPWRAEVDRLTGGILDSIERDGWLCSNPMNLESPGLMTGLAGVGYQLLRLAEPRSVPSVLTLAPPVLPQAPGTGRS
jgi:type 2 lantibiotic biosynthesis protein LanM